jgi:hypothetical protein
MPTMSPLTRMFSRKMGPIGLALTAYDIWRRIPPRHRRRLLAEARKHGPRLAKAAVDRRRNRRP